MKNPIRNYLFDSAKDVCGFPSYCTANEFVLEAAILRAKETGRPVLIEATANQVNRYGGYTGLQPKDFRALVLSIAARHQLPQDQIILGGDHLGPLTWADQPEADAMAKANELVYLYAAAGFTKIHLDTSMKLADDPAGALSIDTVARRGAELYRSAIDGYSELLTHDPDAPRPVFVIGSEVPIPGGAQQVEDSLEITAPGAFLDTVAAYENAFLAAGVPNAMQDVIAVVVQPGVEFGDNEVFYYNSQKASALVAARKKTPDIFFEGHSTDYQTRDCLRSMVRDGIAILKVGPALTFALREALFGLSFIEQALVAPEHRSGFVQALEDRMLASPANWRKHYHGTEEELAIQRKYSLSDRARYYLGAKELKGVITKLFKNIDSCTVPLGLLHQFLPAAYEDYVTGQIGKTSRELVYSCIRHVMMDYEYAAFG